MLCKGHSQLLEVYPADHPGQNLISIILKYINNFKRFELCEYIAVIYIPELNLPIDPTTAREGTFWKEY